MENTRQFNPALGNLAWKGTHVKWNRISQIALIVLKFFGRTFIQGGEYGHPLSDGWVRLGEGSYYFQVPFCSEPRHSGWNQI